MDDLKRTERRDAAAEGQRALTPGEETHRRRARVLLLGCVLLVAFLLPAPYRETPEGETSNAFVNVIVLCDSAAPVSVRLFMIFPAVAGVAVILLAFWATVKARAIGLLVLAGVGIQLLVMFMTAVLSGPGNPGPPSSWVLPAIAASAAMLCLFIGARVRWYRPLNDTASHTGMIGGVLWLGLMVVSLVLTQAGDGSSSSQSSSAGLSASLVVWSVLPMLLVAGAAILCIVNTRSRPPDRASRLAWLASALLVCGCAAALVIGLFLANPLGAIGGDTAPGLVLNIKLSAWIVGQALLLPFATIDLLLGEPV